MKSLLLYIILIIHFAASAQRIQPTKLPLELRLALQASVAE